MSHPLFTMNKDLSEHRYTLVVLDEAHIAKESNTKIHQALLRLKPNRMLLSTATPLNNRTEEVWNLRELVDLKVDHLPKKVFRKQISKLLASDDKEAANKGAEKLKEYVSEYLTTVSKDVLKLPSLNEYTIWLMPTDDLVEFCHILHQNLMINDDSGNRQNCHATMI